MERGRRKMIIDFVDNTFTEQDFIFASSQFLSYDLPDDWNDMKVNDFCDWLESAIIYIIKYILLNFKVR